MAAEQVPAREQEVSKQKTPQVYHSPQGPLPQARQASRRAVVVGAGMLQCGDLRTWQELWGLCPPSHNESSCKGAPTLSCIC